MHWCEQKLAGELCIPLNLMYLSQVDLIKKESDMVLIQIQTAYYTKVYCTSKYYSHFQ